MQIVHSGSLVILPCRPAKTCAPVVGRCLIVLPFTPDIVIAVCIILRLPAFHKPFMFIGGMVHHQIHDDADASFMGCRQHLVEVLHCAEFFHDRLIVTDIIAVVVIGRLIHRREPDHINPQIFQIVQPADNPLQIANPIPVAVHKAARINLINNGFLPPSS